MLRSIVITAIFLLSCLLAGCASPPYEFAAGEKKAKLNLAQLGSVMMCKDGKSYDVSAQDGSQYALIPAGSRISIGHFIYISGYNVTYSCYPYLSFVPAEDQKYVVTTNIVSSKCYIELVREDESRRTGLGVETSVGPRNCFPE